MGVHGLWKLIEPAGKQIPLESLENKVLAVDVSIWLYQLTKGLQTTGGGAIPNAHLLGLFNRICKLLYYRIKPVFVFDGGVPLLKKETIEARKRLKRKAQDDHDQLREKLLTNYLKQKAIRDYLGNEDVSSSSRVIDDMFALPPLPEDDERIDDPDSSDNEAEVAKAKLESICNFKYGKDLHSINIHGEEFKSLPADIRHEILSELIETRKQNSWAKVSEMPEDSYDFSKFQLERLKKRRDVQRSLDSAAKEMGGRSMTLNELEAMFKEDGIVTDNLTGQRIVGDNVTRFVYVTGKSKDKEPVKDVPKPREKKDRVGIKEKQAEMKKIFEISAPEKSSTIDETKFEDDIQRIEDSIFIKDFSSDDELEIVNETIDNEYIRSLLGKERLSQEEILKIIKEEQVEDENSSPSMIFSDTESKAAPHTMVVSAEVHEDKTIEPKLCEEELFKSSNEEQNENVSSSPSYITSDPDNRAAPYTMTVSAEIHDDEIIEPSQEFEKSKLSFLIDKSYQDAHAVVNAGKSADTENEPLPRENKVSESHSIELFVDDSEPEDNFFDEFKPTYQPKDFVPTQILPNRGDNFFDESKRLDHPGDMIPTQILPNRDDNFSDEFKRTDHPGDLIPTQILPDKGDNCFQNEFVSAAETSVVFSDTDSEGFIEVSCEEKSSYFKKDHKEIEISINPSKVAIEDDIFSDVFDVQNPNDTVILEKNPNDVVTFDKNLNDTIIFDDEPFLPRETSNRDIVGKTPPKDGSHRENVKKADVSEKTKSTTPMKPWANILNKVKKAEKTVDEKTTETKASSSSSDKLRNNEKFKEIQEILSREQNELLAESGKKERLGSTITQQMINEAQELLHLFGLPYVVAPMEAEAQCAFLDKISLTEGTITDDSDIWLFGGQKVYKNFFDQKKYVLQFRSVDIEHFFKLSREQLIQMALLVGSDYAIGIEGVGPVTALEILAYFSDSSTVPTSTDGIAETLRKFRVWLKNNRNENSPLSKKCKNANLTEAFPNTTIIEAYMYPTVNESKEGFTWATPDLDRLRTYMNSKFGWKTSRIDEILLPVMKRINEKNKQTTLDMFFKQKPHSTIEFGNVSKRVISAINVMKGKNDERPLQHPSTSKSPRKNPSKTPPKRTRKNVKKTPLKRTPTALPVHITSQNSAAKKVSAPYFGETIPQKEKDKMEAAKRKLDAIKVFQAQKKSNRGKNAKKKKVMPAKPDSSYLSESSSGDDIF